MTIFLKKIRFLLAVGTVSLHLRTRLRVGLDLFLTLSNNNLIFINYSLVYIKFSQRFMAYFSMEREVKLI